MFWKLMRARRQAELAILVLKIYAAWLKAVADAVAFARMDELVGKHQLGACQCCWEGEVSGSCAGAQLIECVGKVFHLEVHAS